MFNNTTHGRQPAFGQSRWTSASTSYGAQIRSGVYNGSKWVINGIWGKAQWAVSGLSSSAYNAIGNIVNNIWQSQPVQSAQQVKVKTLQRIQSTKDGLLRTPPSQLKNLDNQLALISGSKKEISPQEVGALHQALDLLAQNDYALLKQWEPNLSPEDLNTCRSFFQMVTAIVSDQRFAAASANPNDEELQDAALQPLMIEDGQTRLDHFSSLIRKITADNSGYVVKAKDPLMAYKGPITGLLTLAGTLCFTDSPTTVLALSSLAGFVASDTSVVSNPSKALEKAKAFTFCAPLLTQSRYQAQRLQNAIAHNKPGKAVESAIALKTLVKEVSRNPQAVFTIPLTPREVGRFNRLKLALEGWDGSAPLPIDQLKKPVNEALVVLDKKYHAQKGLVESVADVFKNTAAEVIEEPLDHLNEHVANLQETVKGVEKTAQNLLKKNVDNLFGWDAEGAAAPDGAPNPAAPGGPPPAQPAQPAGAAANTEDNFLIQFLEWAASNISKLIGEQNAGKVSEKALSAAAGLIALTLNSIISTMDSGSEAHQTVKERITALISGINESAANRDWKKMLKLLLDAPSIFKGIKGYLGDLRLPIPGTGANLEGKTTADEALADNLSVLNKAIANTEPEPENLNWKELAIQEKDKLVANATSFLTMKHIYEKVCGLQPPNADFYPELLKNATDADTKVLSEEILKELFFAELTANNISVVKRFFAELQYFLYATGVKLFAQKATTIYFEEIFNYIENNNKDEFNFVRGMVINNITRYLTILGGAYKTVANASSATGLMSEMLMKELEKKDSNQGFETTELYIDFAKIILEKTNGTVFAWFISKFLGNPEEIIRSVIDMTTGSLQDTNGYTHALNVVIGDQLDEVWKLLEKTTQPASENDTTTPRQEMSEGQKSQLSILVNNLFEILRKSKCNTVDDLRNLMEGKLWNENANQAIDGFFMPEIIEQTTQILVTAAQSLLQGKRLEKLTYTFAKLINNTFEVAEKVTPAQMQQAEDKVTKRSEQILRFAINTAIKEKLDFSGLKQQNETNGFIEQLHTLSTKHFDAASAHLETLKDMDFSSAEAENKINELIEATRAYKEECQDINRQVKAAKIDHDNREEINKRNLQLAQQSDSFVKATSQLKIFSKSLEDLQKAIPRLQKIKTIIGEMGQKLYDRTMYTSEEDIACAESKMLEFGSLLIELKTVDVLNAGKVSAINLLEFQQKRLEKILIAQRQALSARLLQDELAQSGSLLDIIAQERKTQVNYHLGQPGNPDNANLMRQKLMIVRNESLRAQLHQKLEAIEKAITDARVDRAKAEFLKLLKKAVNEANQQIIPGRSEHWDCSQKIYEIVNDTGLLQPHKTEETKQAIGRSVAEARQHLETLKTWEKDNYKKLVFGNFSSGTATKWMQDIVSQKGSNFVYGRVKERMDGVLNLLKREETYRYGILHHSFLIPYVQRVRRGRK